MAEGRGTVGDSKCSVVVAAERAVVSVSMLALLNSLAKVCREWWRSRRRSRKESLVRWVVVAQGSMGCCGCSWGAVVGAFAGGNGGGSGGNSVNVNSGGGGDGCGDMYGGVVGRFGGEDGRCGGVEGWDGGCGKALVRPCGEVLKSTGVCAWTLL
jgi:hypothetical protein